MLRLTCISFCFLLLASCSKDKEPNDTQSPVVQLLTPLDNQTFTAGQSVSITGNITDNRKLAELHVHISNNTTAQLLIDIHRYPNSPTYSLNESFQAQAGITYRIQIVAVDNSGNQGIGSVMVVGN